MTNLSEIISPAFYEVFGDIQLNKHTHYVFEGGRGSTKSSFISIALPLGIMQDPNANALVLRQTANTLADSVFTQLQWGIDMLGVSDYWECRKSPLKLIYKPTGQQILFRGADDPLKIKSVKPAKGYLKYIWYEEWHEFMGMDAIRNINQSAMRGGDKFTVFYSFNPPKSKNNWVNEEITELRPDRKIHHSTYLETPKEWLGEQFIIEAEHLKETKPEAYRHEYLGEPIGSGGMIFDNVEARAVSQDELNQNQYRHYGIDWGFARDPAVFIATAYDRKKNVLYIYDEIYGIGLTNRKLAELVQEKGYDKEFVMADSSEPKSIYDFYDWGFKISGCKKWDGSVKNNIEFLQSLDKIIIDEVKCPNAKKEFSKYEYEVDRQGRFISKYPDKDNHTIDATAYALNEFVIERKARLKK